MKMPTRMRPSTMTNEVVPSIGRTFAMIADKVRVIVASDAGGAEDAFSTATTRLLDVDNDGLDDIVQLSPPERGQYNPSAVSALSTTRGYMNTGDAFVPVNDSSATGKLTDWRAALANVTTEGHFAWTAKTDVLDLNGDGLPDVAATLFSYVSVCMSLGNGVFGPPAIYVAGEGCCCVEMGDFDGDGISDLALTGGPGWQSLPVAFSSGIPLTLVGGSGSVVGTKNLGYFPFLSALTFTVTNASIADFAMWATAP